VPSFLRSTLMIGVLLALSGCVAPVAQLAATAGHACLPTTPTGSMPGCNAMPPTNALSLDWQSTMQRAAASMTAK
jgi:hypothetical protein